MKILFVSAGKKDGKPGNVVLNQADALIKHGTHVIFFITKGSGVFGYLKSILPLIQEIKRQNPEVVHAHYSLSGFIAGIATRKPVVVSLMGSEMSSPIVIKWIIRFFYSFLWDKVIVKTPEMRTRLKLAGAEVIPNGVDIERFHPMDKILARESLGYSIDEKKILFLADPKRSEKNYSLAKKSVDLLNGQAKLNVIYNIPPDMVCWHINSSDVVLLTSFWEGSPNIIKEAMACNAKIVSTDVGDVKQNILDLQGCYIASFEPEDIAGKLLLALNDPNASNGRERIILLGLDSNSVTKKILNIYQTVTNSK